jgi:hypothetical protein
VLHAFIRKIDPPGPGWARVRADAASDGIALPRSPSRELAAGIACVPAALAAIYASLFGMGAAIFGHWAAAAGWLALALAGSWVIWRLWDDLFELEA